MDRKPLMPLTASADGWRGVIGESFTPSAVARLAAAALDVFGGSGKRILVSHDARKGGPQCVSRIVRAAQRHQCREIVVASYLPTPIAASLLSSGDIDIAFLVTASHNPPDWNGLKIKVGRGGSVSGLMERRIDDLFKTPSASLDEEDGLVADENVQSAHVSTSALVELHCGALQRLIGLGDWADALIVIDGLGGIAGGPVEKLCRKLGARTILLGDVEPETFGGIQPDPTLASSQMRCQSEVVRRNAALGIILDGDGDRVILVGQGGEVWQSQEVLAALLDKLPISLKHQVDGPLLATASSGSLVRRLAREEGRDVIETGIGFKHIATAMHSMPRSVGIGSVGDFGFQSFGTDRDPFALILLLAAAFPNPGDIAETIRELRRRLRTDHLLWFEVLWSPRCLPSADAIRSLIQEVDGVEGKAVACPDGTKFELPDSQWLLVRTSTTEGGVRVYGELTDLEVGHDLIRRASRLDRPRRFPAPLPFEQTRP